MKIPQFDTYQITFYEKPRDVKLEKYRSCSLTFFSTFSRDCDRFSENIFLGAVTIPLENLNPSYEMVNWHQLTNFSRMTWEKWLKWWITLWYTALWHKYSIYFSSLVLYILYSLIPLFILMKELKNDISKDLSSK